MKKKIYIALGVLLMTTGWYAASYTKETSPKSVVRSAESFSFIKTSENKLVFPGERRYWDAALEKMRMLYLNGEGTISFLHMGGSHVQAGTLTDRMRKNLLMISGGMEAEVGFVFPYKLAGTNSPRSVRCQWSGNWTGCRSALSTEHCHWGMSGINASTNDSVASIKLWVTNHDTIARFFNRVKIFSPPDIIDGWDIQIDSIASTHKHVRKHAYTEFSLAQLTDTLRVTFTRKNPEAAAMILQGVYLGLSEEESLPGITYNAIGVNGAGTYSYLRCEDFEKQMHGIKPDVVVFGIGVNDANVPEGDFNPEVYEARYDSLIYRIREVNPECAFLFISNNDTYYQKKYPNRNAFRVQETMKRLAEKHGGAFYDLFDIMGGLGSISQWKNASLASSDLVHLTREGYELQADMMFSALRDALGDYMDMKGLP